LLSPRELFLKRPCRVPSSFFFSLPVTVTGKVFPVRLGGTLQGGLFSPTSELFNLIRPRAVEQRRRLPLCCTLGFEDFSPPIANERSGLSYPDSNRRPSCPSPAAKISPGASCRKLLAFPPPDQNTAPEGSLLPLPGMLRSRRHRVQSSFFFFADMAAGVISQCLFLVRKHEHSPTF